MSRRRIVTFAVGLISLVVAAVGVAVTVAPSAQATSTASHAAQCTAPRYSRTRDPANPLALNPAPPASDPLRGARLWVPGPAIGDAAGAIAQLLGIDTNEKLGTRLVSLPVTESWATFAAHVTQALPHLSKTKRYDVGELEKIAAQPATLRLSTFSAGGSPAGLYGQAEKFLCTYEQQDPGSIMVLSTYFLQPTLGGAATAAKINAYAPEFKAQIDATAQAIGDRPVVIVAEEDAVGASYGMTHTGGLEAWESLLKYEVTTFEKLPHTAVYLEGGYSDAESVDYTAKVLNASGIHSIQGFFTNDTHFQWDSNELKFATKVSARTGHAHFIINTADNGRGPILNKRPVEQGIEELCNPPDRGLGIAPTTDPSLPTAFATAKLDAFLWTYPPGFSDGACNGGPPNGSYWVARAITLARLASSKLGPGYPSS